MDENRQTKRKNFLVNIAFWAVIIAFVFFILKYFINLIMPFFIAAILAALSRPLAKWLSSETKTVKDADGNLQTVRRRVSLNHGFAAVLSVLILFLLILGVLTLICVRLVNTGADLVARLPDLYYSTLLPDFEALYNDMLIRAAGMDSSVLELIQNSVPNLISSIGSMVTNFSAKILVWISALASKFPSLLLNTLICLIATVFIAVDFDSITAFIRRNVPAHPLELTIKIKDTFIDIVWQFIRSYFYIFLITASEITVGMLIIGQKNPLLIGIIIAIFDAFPIVGSGMVLLPWTLITLISGNIGKGIGLLIVYLIVVIARQIIEPKLVGKHVGLRPIVTLMCMFVGTKLFGGLGLFGLPISAAIITDMNNSGAVHFFKTRETEAASFAAAQAETEKAAADTVETQL